MDVHEDADVDDEGPFAQKIIENLKEKIRRLRDKASNKLELIVHLFDHEWNCISMSQSFRSKFSCYRSFYC